MLSHFLNHAGGVTEPKNAAYAVTVLYSKGIHKSKLAIDSLLKVTWLMLASNFLKKSNSIGYYKLLCKNSLVKFVKLLIYMPFRVFLRTLNINGCWSMIFKKWIKRNGRNISGNPRTWSKTSFRQKLKSNLAFHLPMKEFRLEFFTTN